MTTVPDFESTYAADPDPWQVGSRWYERRKIAVTTAALTRPRYRTTWDAACGTGHLTVELALRSDRTIASDAAATACRLTSERLADLRIEGHMIVLHHALPAALPQTDGAPPDLVMLSEVLYYLPEDDLARMPAVLDETCDPDDAEVVAVNWRHHPDDAHTSGTAAAEVLDRGLQRRGWRSEVRYDDVDFIVRGWRRDPRT